MPKLLTNREMEIFRIAMMYCKKYYDCNPDVEMGPWGIYYAEEVAKKLSFKIDPEDLEEMCEIISGRGN